MTDTTSAEPSTDAPTLEFLRWVAAHRRTYADTMSAWQTTCPRFSVWENAKIDGLLCVETRQPFAESVVRLTPRGRAILSESI